MTEGEFLAHCERVLRTIEEALDDSGIDVDASRNGAVLELEFDDGSKIVVNGNAPVREIWVAARAGGFHFRHQDGRWVDTRSGDALFPSLSRLVEQQCGEAVAFAGD
ncbi:MAG: frataxin, iron-binding and oxidizing protein [Pseudomonadota bacterium]|jgi:CyaY protein